MAGVPHQSLVVLSRSPVAGPQAAAQANCEEDEERGEDDVAGVAEETGADQPALDVLDAGVLPPVWTDVQTGQHRQVDPQQAIRQHAVCGGLYGEMTCRGLGLISPPADYEYYRRNSGCAYPRF